MIIKSCSTKSECVNLFIKEDFDRFPSHVVTKHLDEDWEFFGMSYDEDEEGEVYTYVDVPMWSFWYIPNDSYVIRFIEEHEEEVANCGFTIVKYEGELFALGIDGAGYSFSEAHFEPLYDLMNMNWHD